MNKHNRKNRILSLVLTFAILFGCIPGGVWSVRASAETNASEEQNSPVSQVSSERTTIYISSSGNEWYSGTSESWPKKDITKIPAYLEQGYNVLLKRGDVWYLPTQSLSLTGIAGTEESPVVLGSYGDAADPKPIIAYMKKIENTAWTLADAEKSIYKTDVSNMTARGDTDIRVHRLFVKNVAYLHRSVTDYTQLAAEQFCDYGGTLYVRTDGDAPTDVEVTPYAGSGKRLMITDASYLTIENIHFKGSSALNPMIQLNAPTSNVKMQYCDITHCFYYILQIISDGAEDNYKPEIGHCYMDACFSEAEAANSGAGGLDMGHWDAHLTEGITMRDGVDGAWIHHNHIRNMSHAFIAIESLDKAYDTETKGVRNCYIEDNLLEGDGLSYSRAFNICGGFNLSGVQMCRNNTFRRNKCYDMSTASHLFGENNLIYSNIFSYVHCQYTEDGVLTDGKGAVPWAFDTIPYSDHTSVGNMVINNTFYDVGSAIGLNDRSNVVYDNIYANNLIVNWTSDTAAYINSGAISDLTVGQQYVMNNGVYAAGRTDHFMVDSQTYTAEEANSNIVGYSGNISADPQFLNADLSLDGMKVRQDFTLSSESPMRYAGLSVNDSVYESFPAWQRLKEEYTDVNGNPYNPDAPSIGAVSYSDTMDETVNITELVTTVAPVGIVAGYKTYWGENWQDALSVPNVTVKTSDGGTATVAVAWDYAPLGDLTEVGKYVITGTLVSDIYGNPDNIVVQQEIYIREKTNLLYNGNFADRTGAASSRTAPGWSFAWLQYVMKNPDNAQDYLIRLSKSTAVDNSTALTTDAAVGTPTLSEAIKNNGAGQYYIQFDAKSVAYSSDTVSADARTDISLWPVMMYHTDANATSEYKVLTTGKRTALRADEWVTVGHHMDINTFFAQFRLDIKGSAPTVPAYLYLDNIEVIPLKVALKDPSQCQHSTYWDSVIAPTCTDAGYTMHICLDCGSSYHDTEVAALGHTAGKTVTENEKAPTCGKEGSYDSVVYCSVCKVEISRETLAGDPATGEHNYVDGVCDVCGAEEVTGPAVDENLKFNAAPGLSFKDYIGMQILVTSAVAQNYDRVWIEAVQADPAGDVTTTLEGVSYYYGIYLKFEQQVLSWSMAENITLTLWAEKDGETVKGETFSGSVEDLALEKIASYATANNTAAVTALVDMLNYGAAVQTSFNHNADMLPNTNLGSYTGTTATPEFDATNSITGTGSLTVASNSISMQAKVEIQLLIMGKIDGYTVSAKVGGADAPVVVDTEKYAGYGWTLVKVAVAADKMREVYTISVNDANGTPVTSVYNVSVEAYGKTQLEGAKADVVIAMMRYGDSVAAL